MIWASLIPAAFTVLRTSLTVVAFARPTVMRLPPLKSMPRLSCLVANEIAPISRMQPESEKK